jgi:FtsH-binding integral membrane protein
MTTATRHGDLQQPGRAQPTTKSRIGLIVALSMAAGLIAAVVLVAMPFIPAARENVLTGVVLLAFALGWALLAVLSTRFSDQPQRWAAAPAMFMAVAGLVSLSGSAAVQAGFAGYGRQSCSDWLSGCSFGSGAACAPESDGGCCTPY